MKLPFLALVALALLVGPSSASAQALVSVDIVDTPRPQDRWGYAPANRRVAVGTWVTWSNSGEDAHTVTALDGTFDSDVLNPSEGFSFYFDQPGQFEYVCGLHAWMTGTVVVGNGSAAEPRPEVMPIDLAPEPAPEMLEPPPEP